MNNKLNLTDNEKRDVIKYLELSKPLPEKYRFFLFGVLPSKYSGRWRNNADEVLAKLFFGERICQNFGSFVFEFGCRKWKRRGLGRNFPFAPLFSFGEIRAGYSFDLPRSRSFRTISPNEVATPNNVIGSQPTIPIIPNPNSKTWAIDNSESRT